MKKAALILIGILFFSCNQGKSENLQTTLESKVLEVKTENYDWLLGNWMRTNEKKGKETVENWNKVNDTTYSGIGFTLQNNDTIFKEKMNLMKVRGKWNLTVTVSQDAAPSVFKGIEHNENEFICENKENDFPNIIKYWKKGKNLNAEISGGETKVLFEFEK